MTKAATYLAGVGAIALVALASATPASANPSWRHHWGPDVYIGPGYAYDYPYPHSYVYGPGIRFRGYDYDW
jgi:hypothetical protein